MQKRRGILLALVLAVLAGASVGTGAYLYVFRLPDPAHADQQGLLRWLVLRDLAQEPVEIRHKLVERFEAQIYAGGKLTGGDHRLTPQQRAQVRRNVEVLVEDWFRMKAAAFFALPSSERIKELDRHIDGLQNSGIVEQLAAAQGTSGDRPAEPMELFAKLGETLQRWVERSEPAERERVGQFAAAVQGRILMRALESLMP